MIELKRLKDVFEQIAQITKTKRRFLKEIPDHRSLLKDVAKQGTELCQETAQLRKANERLGKIKDCAKNVCIWHNQHGVKENVGGYIELLREVIKESE